MNTIQTMINVFLTAFIIACMMGCSSTPQITKWTSPDLRIAVDPMGIDSANYVRLEEALVNTNKFFVIDRGSGFQAVVKEQDYVHGVAYGSDDKPNTFERYGDQDRYARLGKLYSVGSVIVAQTRCATKSSFWSGYYKHCEQYLALINSSTGEVVAAVSGVASDAEDYYGVMNIAASWDGVVEKLVQAIPKEYTPNKYDERMRIYRNEIREDSIRRREQLERNSN